ncbi:MAG TPA: D-aminoacylase [Gemmatimonadales bacterium]|nr:D-aminoacylase [Gemmatimonadales bacterium]
MRLTAASLVLLGLALVTPAAAQRSVLIHDALLYDGSGRPPVRGSLRVENGVIAAMGDLTPLPGETVVEAGGRALAPGFIDTHSHADDDLEAIPDALGAVSQGITTVIGGQDGGSPFPLADYFARLARHPVAVNLAAYAGHNTLRGIVMGEHFQRVATPEEVGRMRFLLRREMAAGALGLSTGLEYDPGIYSSRDEVLALAAEAARDGGRYISHVRSEDRYFWAAIDEIVTIGRVTRMPVQVSHIKLAMRNLWGRADSLVALLDAARAAGVDITADIYPYPYWHSTLTVLFPSRDYTDRHEAEVALTEVSTPAGLLLGRYRPDTTLSGKTVADVARLWGVDSVTALIELIRKAQVAEAEGMTGVESVIGTSMTEPDIARLMRWPHTNFCTDGELDGKHPRGFGSFPRVLGRYVREQGVLTLEEAIHRSTALAADHMGITDRGRLATGQAADLVLFDPATVVDRATPQDPHALSQGIVTVWVNGSVVYQDGRTTSARPGVVLRRRAS